MQNEVLRGNCAVLMPARIALGMVCVAWSLTALAAPAPWHQWSSRLNGALVCAQTSPGPGWAHARGPFKEAGCHTLLLAPERTPEPEPGGAFPNGELRQLRQATPRILLLPVPAP